MKTEDPEKRMWPDGERHGIEQVTLLKRHPISDSLRGKGERLLHVGIRRGEALLIILDPLAIWVTWRRAAVAGV